MTLRTRPVASRRIRRAALRSTALAATTAISQALARQVFAAEPSRGSAAVNDSAPPPVARVSPVRETFFGQVVVDPYRWMEDPRDRDWEPFMRGQDAHARKVLHGIPGRDALARRIGSLSASTTVAVGAVAIGQRIFYEVRPAGAANYMLAVRDQPGSPERILLDPTSLKGPDGTHVSLDWWVPSPDARHVVYGLSPAGSENSVLHVMQVDTGRVLDERIPGTQYASPSWLPDGSGFFYGRVADPTQLGTVEYYKRSPVLLHRLGDDPKRDRLVVAHGRDPALPLTELEFPSIACASGSRWAVLTLTGGVRRENPAFVAPLEDVVSGRARWRQVCAIADEVTAIEFDATHLYLLSTRGAPNGQILRAPLDGGTCRRAERVVREGPKVIESMALARDGLYIADLDGGYSTLRKLGRDGRLTAVPLPFEGAIGHLQARPVADGCFLEATGWLLPLTTFRHEPSSGRTEPAGLAPPAALDLSPYEAIRAVVRARDGTRVPLSIVARRDLPRDGRNPVLVQAYGAYQVSSSPEFNVRYIAMLERGGVLVTAHVRGGGEYGKRWWKGGFKLTKPNTWRDLIDCCEHLVRTGWGSRETIVIQGGSAGGIAVGRALTERPDLFAGVISNVGVSNALRAEFAQNGPPNIDEFGTVTERDGFRGLKAMDALHHVRDGTRYPAVLLTAGMTDPRVEPWQAAKMAARLQRATRSGRPVLLRVGFDAGHGLGSTRLQIDDERTDEFAFALWCAGRASVG